VHFRVWAPRARRVEVDLGGRRIALRAEDDGYHAGLVPGVGAGARYTPRAPAARPR
jgi:maltooligosyltrehalose trehalohydrolase